MGKLDQLGHNVQNLVGKIFSRNKSHSTEATDAAPATAPQEKSAEDRIKEEKEKAARERREKLLKLAKVEKLTMSGADIRKNLIAKALEEKAKKANGGKKDGENKDSGSTGTTDGSTDTQAPPPPSGLEKLNKIIESPENETLKVLIYILGEILYPLLRFDLRSKDNSDSLLNYLGFNREVALRYFQALFGQFGNLDLRSLEDVKKLLLQPKTFDDLLYYDAMGLIDQSPEQFVKNQCHLLSETASNLKQIWKIQNLDKIYEIINNLVVEEALKSSGGKKVCLSDQYMCRKADAVDKHKGELTKNKETEKDIPELTKLLSEIEAKFPPKQVPQPQPVPPNPAPAPRPITQPTAQPVAQPVVANPAPIIIAPIRPKFNLNLAQLLQDASPELMGAIGRLKELYAKCKNMDEQSKDDLAHKISQTTVSQGNMLWSDFHDANSPNIFQMLIEEFGLVSNASLEAKILEIDCEFTAKNIYI